MLQCLALLCALVSAGDAFAVQPPFRAASHGPVGSSRPVMLEPLTVGGMAKLGLVIGMALGKRAIKDERPAEGTICQECEACASQKYLERCLARPSATTSRGRRRSPGPTMLDSNLLVGGVMLVGGTALGVGGIAFIENRGEKSKDSMSDETKSRMAGMWHPTWHPGPMRPLTRRLSRLATFFNTPPGRNVYGRRGARDAP